MSSSESTVHPATRLSRGLLARLVPLVAFGALILPGCTADYATQGDATVLLSMDGVNGGLPMDSDVRISNGGICPDGVSITLSSRDKNPISGADTGRLGDIFLERYEVQYFRSDGRATEGVDVPYRISGNMAARIENQTAATVTIELVRRQAKVEPPLSSLAGGGGPFVLTMFAQVTVHGRTISGQTTNAAVGRVQVDFADFRDTLTTCPEIGG
jgi:hypothetical protein